MRNKGKILDDVGLKSPTYNQRSFFSSRIQGLKKLLKLTTSGWSKPNQKLLLAYLILILLWILANIASELTEEFSFFLEPVFAFFQWLVWRRYYKHLGWWILASWIGWLASVHLFKYFGVANWVGDSIVNLVPAKELEIGGESLNLQLVWFKVLLRQIEWTVIGIAQWLIVLRRHFPHSGWWILFSSIGGGVKGYLELTINILTGGVLGIFIAPIGYGLVTGIPLVWLLKEEIKERLLHLRTRVYY